MSPAPDYITRMRPQDILMPVPAGLCCKPGGFHIDPVRPVERAVITHGHSEHARPGHGAVLDTQETLDMMRLRYGDNFAGRTQAIGYGEQIKLGDVTIKFHRAGHVLGSAQIAVTANGLRVVASGDYKNVADPTCAPFELIACDVLIGSLPEPNEPALYATLPVSVEVVLTCHESPLCRRKSWVTKEGA